MRIDPNTLTKKQKYYPWVVMAACCLYMAGGIGIGTNCTGVFMRPVADALGVGIGSVSIYGIVLNIVNAAMAPWVGRAIGRIDIRKLMTIGTSLIGGAFLLLSLSQNLLFVYAGGALVGAGVSMGTFMAINVIINNWFIKNNGLVMGITMSTSSLVGIIANPAVNWVIEHFGWRIAYAGMGVLIFCTLPLIWIFIRMYPDQKGTIAWGEETLPEPEIQTTITHHAPIEEQKIDLRHPALLAILAFVFVLPLANSHAGYFQNVALSYGFSAAIGASMISASLAGEFIGKLGIGWLSDRMGINKTIAVVTAMGAAGLIGLFFMEGRPAWYALVCALVYGPMQAIGTIGYPQIIRNNFGAKFYPLIYPYMSIAGTISSSLASPAYGYIYDATGSFVPTFVIALAGLALALLLLVLCEKTAKQMKK